MSDVEVLAMQVLVRDALLFLCRGPLHTALEGAPKGPLRASIEALGAKLLAIAAAHGMIATAILGGQAPAAALLIGVPLLRAAYLNYYCGEASSAFSAAMQALEQSAEAQGPSAAGPAPESLAGVDVSVRSVVVMPLQQLAKTPLVLSAGDADETRLAARAAVEALLRDIEDVQAARSSEDKKSRLARRYSVRFEPSDVVVSECLLWLAPGADARPCLFILLRDAFIAVAFKDRRGAKAEKPRRVPLADVLGVRNGHDGSMTVSLARADMRLFSDDTLLIAQCVLDITTAVDRHVNAE